MNYARFLNAVSLARKPSPIRVLAGILAKSPPSMISLAAGNPNPDCFPFQSADIKLTDGSTISLDNKQMKVALQYCATQGIADLLSWLRRLQEAEHNPPTLNRALEDGGLDLLVTCGSQDGLSKSFDMLVNAGDNVIVEAPTYAGTLAAIRPLGCRMLPVETDGHGMVPGALRKTLSKWTPQGSQDPNSDAPRVMYTIPNGANPTGASLTLDRKKEIYSIAQDYNLLIMEDDPYYYLQFKQPVPSYLSLDVDGRVLRYDSFSKILSSGLRVGFVSGPQPLVNRIQMHMMVSCLHTPAMSQVLVNEILQRWDIPGFREHVQSVVEFYSRQKDVMMECAKRHLTGLAEWHEPVAGMFLWMKLKGIEDTKKLIEEKALEKEVLLVPGCAFMPDDEAPCPYVRASFSLASAEQIDKGLERLASLIREERK